MPLVLHDDRFDAVLGFLQMHSGDVTLGQIRNVFSPPLPVRTAHRLAQDLVTLGVLTSISGGRFRRYQLRTKPGAFGQVLWFHPDSAGALAVAAPAADPVKHRAAAAAKRDVRVVTNAATPKRAAPAEIDGTANVERSAASRNLRDEGVAAPVNAAVPAAEPDIRVVTNAATVMPVTKTIAGPRVQAVLDKVLPKLLTLSIVPERVLPELNQPAISVFVLKPGEDVADLATLVTAALDRLTEAEAVTYGCAPAAFARWREIQWPAGWVLQPRPPIEPLPPLALPKPLAPERLQVFLREVRYVVMNRIKSEALRPYLETQKGWLRGDETVDDWVAVLTAELNRLRIEDAIARNIPADRYRLWRKEAWPV
jgi:hypothetical protein